MHPNERLNSMENEKKEGNSITIRMIQKWIPFWICGISLTIFMFIINIEIFVRRFFNIAFGWTTEGGEYLLVLITLLSGGYCLLNNSHVRVDIIYTKFSTLGKKCSDLFTYSIIMLISFIMVWNGGQIAWEAFVNWECSDSVYATPLFPVYSMVPIGGILFGYAAAYLFVKTIREKKK
jgi:TRAP-type mannitol/chloroaromatic compound transport system permease small subunit